MRSGLMYLAERCRIKPFEELKNCLRIILPCQFCRKVSQQVEVLKRIKRIPLSEICAKLYQSFIVPHFNYCAETWHFCRECKADKLEKINERALCFVYKDSSSPHGMLLTKMMWPANIVKSETCCDTDYRLYSS